MATLGSGLLIRKMMELLNILYRCHKKFTEDYPEYFVDVKLCAFSTNEMDSAEQVFEEYFD